MQEDIKCPRCQNTGYKYLTDKRWFFRCPWCEFETYLKLLNLA